ISGPLLDRIDLHIEVNPVPFEKLSEKTSAENSESIRKRVVMAREIQSNRFNKCNGIHYNAQMPTKLLNTYCALDDASTKLLQNAMEKLNLSARAYDRILKVSRTIADLDKAYNILP